MDETIASKIKKVMEKTKQIMTDKTTRIHDISFSFTPQKQTKFIARQVELRSQELTALLSNIDLLCNWLY